MDYFDAAKIIPSKATGKRKGMKLYNQQMEVIYRRMIRLEEDSPEAELKVQR